MASANATGRKKKNEVLKNKKENSDNIQEAEPKEEKIDGYMEDEIKEHNVDEGDGDDQKQMKSRKKKRRKEKRARLDNTDDVDMEASQIETKNQVGRSEALAESSSRTKKRPSKAKKVREAEVVERLQTNDEQDLLENRKEAEDEVYHISEDENSSQGMKKWIMEYHYNRPGLKVLQERIDDFITAHEAQEEQARRERKAQAEEGGWQLVTHQKGRKKTTDAESGIAVGSVSEAAVLDKLAKKKNKDVGLDFYRFQKREANRNEIMMLRSRFEQDKKRMQELRAQRKFRPY